MEAALKRLDWPEEFIAQMALAVDEALANVIRHGYEGREDGEILLRFETLPAAGDARGDGQVTGEGGGVKIVIEDEGRQVDPSAIRGRELSEVRPGGLGVHIMRQVMDEITYEQRAEQGMRLVMIRQTPGAGCRAEPRQRKKDLSDG